MSKKKKVNIQQEFSPEQFIKKRVRNLAIGDCYISKNFKEDGEGYILITRKHKEGKKSYAIFLVDFFCLGVKDSFCGLLKDEEDFNKQFKDLFPFLKEITYVEAHNYIYGAIEFAKEAGIALDESFNLTRFFLEEDTEEIPLIEYNFGKDGQHFFIAQSEQEASKYLPILKKNLGENFKYTVPQKQLEPIHQDEDEESEATDDDFDIDEILKSLTPEKLQDIMENHPLFKKYGENTPFTYVHPHYPQRLVLKNKALKAELFEKDDCLSLKTIQEILSLPHDTLRQDLEKIILYSVDQASKKDYEKLVETGIDKAIVHSIFLIAEIGDEHSLYVVLEALRQPEEVSDKLYGDIISELFIPTIYKLGKSHLDKLMLFAKEEGLYTPLHSIVFSAVSYIDYKEPDRRKEIIEWFREILTFAQQTLPDNRYYDVVIVAYIICDLMDMKAKELLPEIKVLFDMNVVDLGICGSFANVVEELNNNDFHPDRFEGTCDLIQRYSNFQELIG